MTSESETAHQKIKRTAIVPTAIIPDIKGNWSENIISCPGSQIQLFRTITTRDYFGSRPTMGVALHGN
jgi:hypothetical protein